MKHLGQGSLFLGLDLNPGFPEYEAGVVNARPGRQVFVTVYTSAN
jgi:hypothetical protein